jgi:rhamnogalacturonyl hydrolase YesR
MRSWLCLCLLFPAVLRAEEGDCNRRVDEALRDVLTSPGVLRFDVGVTRRGTRIPALVTRDDLDLDTKRTRVLLVGGIDGDADEVRTVLAAVRWFHSDDAAAPLRRTVALSAVPVVNPDDWAEPNGRQSTDAVRAGLTNKDAYDSRRNPEGQYLWRWIGLHAPDVVFVCEDEDTPDSIAAQLRRVAPTGTGTVPALAVAVGADERPEAFARRVCETVRSGDFAGPSPARRELQARVRRSPFEVAKQLAEVYGHELKSVEYIPAMALVGRLQLGELTDDPRHRRDVDRVVAPYVTGEKPTLGRGVGGSHLAGHLVFGELARRAEQPETRSRLVALARQAADLGFDADGKPLPSMPHHNEMSDAVFMGCPILVQVGRLTGEDRYFDQALAHLRFVQRLCLRDDGLYRHSPLDETAWGRGNGFPALGLALCLSDLPKEHPAFPQMLADFRRHMDALRPHQDVTGMWHQVVDRPGSYRELTGTCMITVAMLRGIREGWLDRETFQPVVDRAVPALLARIAPDGTLVDVCTGTGKQPNLRAYFDRAAILGQDPRGGAMALLFVTELAQSETN